MKRHEEYKDSGVEWLKVVPKHWEVTPLKRFVAINSEVLSEATSPDFDFLYIDIGNVNEGGIIAIPERVRFGQAPSRARRIIRQGDTIISTVRTYLKAIAFMQDQAHDLIASTGFAVLSPYRKTLPKYIFYLVQSHTFINQVSANSYGVNYPAITPGQLGNLKLAITRDRKEQEAIVAFLDRKLTDIDRFIANKERLIALLKEQKAAIINRAVTKGIDQDVPMKPSGIEWLGEIPAHWKPLRVKFLLTSMEQGWSPQCEERLKNVNEWGVLKVGCVNHYIFNETEHKALPSNLAPKTQYEIKVGDILISRANTRELVGSLAYVEKVSPHLLLCDKLYRVRLRERIFPAFFVHALSSLPSRLQIELGASGASGSMQNISQDVIKNLWIAVPPIQEQTEILSYISKRILGIHKTICRTEREIELIKEFRTTLISDVVTGKIDVRTAIREETPV